jgi:hypothetical protein
MNMNDTNQANTAEELNNLDTQLTNLEGPLSNPSSLEDDNGNRINTDNRS